MINNSRVYIRILAADIRLGIGFLENRENKVGGNLFFPVLQLNGENFFKAAQNKKIISRLAGKRGGVVRSSMRTQSVTNEKRASSFFFFFFKFNFKFKFYEGI